MSQQFASSETSRWDRLLNRAANVLVVIVGLMTLAVGVRYFATPRTEPSRAAPNASRGPSPGQQLSVNGIDWAASKGTIVLALSPTCRFCLESNAFYQKLAEQANGKGGRVRVMALFRASEAVGRAYVTRYDIAVSQVASSRSAPITATPTLLFVNDRGVIQKAWVGKLSSEQENAVIALLD